MSAERRPEEQVLDRLILELRDQASPELDWQKLEARLLREPQPEPRSALLSFVSRLRWPAAGLVASVVVILLVVAYRRPVHEPTSRTRAVASGPLNGDQLALGTRITAGNQPVVVEHRGRARWTLEPHAAASVSDAGEFLTLRLDAGALSAEVVPSPKLETFAVEVAGTRVAVHGTAFRVERVSDRVLVTVSEGTVAVEPVGTHATPAFLLRRDSRGNFGLDGHTGSVEGNASAFVHDSAAQSRREIARVPPPGAARGAKRPSNPAPLVRPGVAAHPVSATSPGPAPSEVTPQVAELPLQPSISDIETGVSSLLALVNQCFHDKTRSTDIHVSATSGLTLIVDGEGTAQSVTFAPPLAPAVEDCAVLGLRDLRFARSVEGVTFTRVFELTR